MMSVPRLFLSALRRAWWNFKVLGDAPRELWITTVFVRILLAFSYFSLASMLVAIEEFDFGFSDGKSMRIFGFWGLCISGFSLITGSLIDYTGVRNSLVIGAFFQVCGFVTMAFTFHPEGHLSSSVQLAVGLNFLIPIGLSLGLAVCDVGTKQYTYGKNSDVAFSLAYAMNNIGAVIGSLVLFLLVLRFSVFGDAEGNTVVETLPPAPTTSIDWTSQEESNFTSSPSSSAVVAASVVGVVGSALAVTATAAATTTRNNLTLLHHRFSANRVMLLVCAISSALAGLIASLTIGDVFVDSHGKIVSSKTVSAHQRLQHYNQTSENGGGGASSTATVGGDGAGGSSVESTSQSTQPTDRWNVRATWTSLKRWLVNDLAQLPRQPLFRRLSLFVLLSLFTRHVFQQLNTVLPLYLYRVFGERAPVNAFYAINPLIVSVLTPIMPMFTRSFDTYNVIVFGSAVASSALLLFVVFVPTYTSVSLALALFSVGESIYSPALTRYVMVLSPEGSEGQYSALTSAPMFLGKLLVAVMSGNLLEAECPRGGNNSKCANVWATISGVSFITPIALALFRSYIHNDEARQKLQRIKRAAGELDRESINATGGDSTEKGAQISRRINADDDDDDDAVGTRCGTGRTNEEAENTSSAPVRTAQMAARVDGSSIASQNTVTRPHQPQPEQGVYSGTIHSRTVSTK